MADENKDKQPTQEGKRIIGKIPFRESYSPEKDTLDTAKPPEGSGVPPKNSRDNKDSNKK